MTCDGCQSMCNTWRRASLDVQGYTSLSTRSRGRINAFFRQAYAPALAKNLFEIGTREHFDSIISKYPGAEYLAQRLGLRAEILQEDFDIEHELRAMADDPDPLIQEHYKHIPPYLRDLLALSSYHWTPLATHYSELINVLLSENHFDLLFLVLNYDTLLEIVLTRYNPKWVYAGINDYVREERTAKVVKLHGSVDWFKAIGEASRGKSWDDLVVETDVLSKPSEGEIRVKTFGGTAESDIVRSHQLDDKFLYPILTAPLSGKGLKDMVCPDSHENAARQFLRDCRKFLVIGTAGHDVDLLELLNDEIDPDSRCVLHFVGKGRLDAANALNRFEERVSAFRRSKSIRATKMYDGGFKEFVHQKGLEAFARAVADET